MSNFDKYKDFTKIAEGGFSEVYLATTPDGNRTVAVKKLKKEFLADVKMRQTIETEIEFLQKIRNAQIPAYLDSCLDEQECLVVMEYIQGTNLASRIEKSRESGTFLPPEFIFETFDQVCVLLDYLHNYKNDAAQGPIIHGDIKPKNIMITPENKAILIDFSVAMHHDPNRKMTGGTYRYMPAELYAGHAPAPQSDLFALMLTFYEMLMLQPLVREHTLVGMFEYLLSGQHIEKIKRMRLRKPLEELLLKGLAAVPEDRFSTAREMAAAAKQISYTVPPSS